MNGTRSITYDHKHNDPNESAPDRLTQSAKWYIVDFTHKMNAINKIMIESIQRNEKHLNACARARQNSPATPNKQNICRQNHGTLKTTSSIADYSQMPPSIATMTPQKVANQKRNHRSWHQRLTRNKTQNTNKMKNLDETNAEIVHRQETRLQDTTGLMNHCKRNQKPINGHKTTHGQIK